MAGPRRRAIAFYPGFWGAAPVRTTQAALAAALLAVICLPAALAQGDGEGGAMAGEMGGAMAGEMGGAMAGEMGGAMAGDDRLVVIETASGTFTIELFDDDAPNHASNLRNLADTGYYNGTLFHRIISGFMIQGGDDNTKEGNPSTWGQGGEAYGPNDNIDAEFNDIMHVPGIVSMARSASPDSAGSQFFIVHGDATFLDGQYTAFGRIVTEESRDALEAIATLETTAGDQPVDTDAARVLGAYTVARSEAGELLELGEPERTGDDGATDEEAEDADPSLITPADLEDGVYRNARLGISFAPPAGWSVQELPTPKPGPEVPDLVVVGPEDDGLPPVISLDVQFAADRTLEEYIEHRNSFRAVAIESGELEIEGAEGAEINGREALAQDARGTFVSQGAEREIAFREIVTESEGKFYALTFMSEADEFEGNMGLFEGTLGTFMVPADAQGEDAGEDMAREAGAERGGGCLIATAAHGTEMAAEVQALREIRDSVLLSTGAGSAFMSAFNGVYYSFSPAVADWERESPELRAAVRALLAPMLASLSIMSAAEPGSELGVAALGSLVIALNAGLYVAAPAALAWRLGRR